MKKLLAVLLLFNFAYAGWVFFATDDQQQAGDAASKESAALPIFTVAEVQSGPNAMQPARLERSGVLNDGSLLGGFEEQDVAARLLQRLLSLNISGKLVEKNEIISVDYLVYMQAGESRRLALRKVDELASKGLEASIVDRKERADFIMVFGSYTAEHAAYARLAEVARHGYPVEVSEIERTSRTYWVEIGADSLRLLDEQVLAVLRRDFSGLKQI